MKKNDLGELELSKEFLKNLLAPFTPEMKNLVSIKSKNGKVIVTYRKEGGAITHAA